MGEPVGISIIVPCYNAGSYLLESVQSILDQEFDLAPYEIIIVNDKSTDQETLDALTLLEKSSAPIRVIHHTDNDKKGPSAARNTAIKHAQYKYIVPVDADDKLVVRNDRTGYLHQVFENFESDPDLDIIYAKVQLFGALNASFHTANYQERLMLVTNLLHAFGAYRKEDAVSMGGYDEDIWGTEDYLFWVSMLNHNHKSGKTTKVHCIDDELYLYRQHEHQLNVDASHGRTYREMMEIVTSKNPEIYGHYFKGTTPEQLPEFLEKYITRFLKTKPYKGEPDAQKWFDNYTQRYGIS